MMSHLCSQIKSLISKALVESDLILIKPDLRVLSSLEQFPMSSSVELTVDNLFIGTKYLLIVVEGFGCLCRWGAGMQ